LDLSAWQGYNCSFWNSANSASCGNEGKAFFIELLFPKRFWKTFLGDFWKIFAGKLEDWNACPPLEGWKVGKLEILV